MLFEGRELRKICFVHALFIFPLSRYLPIAFTVIPNLSRAQVDVEAEKGANRPSASAFKEGSRLGPLIGCPGEALTGFFPVSFRSCKPRLLLGWVGKRLPCAFEALNCISPIFSLEVSIPSIHSQHHDITHFPVQSSPVQSPEPEN